MELLTVHSAVLDCSITAATASIAVGSILTPISNLRRSVRSPTPDIEKPASTRPDMANGPTTARSNVHNILYNLLSDARVHLDSEIKDNFRSSTLPIKLDSSQFMVGSWLAWPAFLAN